MPAILRKEDDNVQPQTNGDGNAAKTSGHLTGNPDDAVQHLPKTTQDILQLHAPRQTRVKHRNYDQIERSWHEYGACLEIEDGADVRRL